jgi:hypothetical protein
VLEKLQRTFPTHSSEWKSLEQQRERKTGETNYWNGKKAFARGDTASALEYFRNAKKSLRGLNLTATILLLRTMPNVLLRIHRLKQRLKSTA